MKNKLTFITTLLGALTAVSFFSLSAHAEFSCSNEGGSETILLTKQADGFMHLQIQTPGSKTSYAMILLDVKADQPTIPNPAEGVDTIFSYALDEQKSNELDFWVSAEPMSHYCGRGYCPNPDAGEVSYSAVLTLASQSITFTCHAIDQN